MEQKVKVSRKKIREKLQNGLDANRWSIIGTGGTNVALLKPLIEYLRKAGNVGLGIGTLFALAGCSGATGNIAATDPTERGLSYIAAAVVTHAVISLFR